LKESGIVERKGAKKTGKWIVKDKAGGVNAVNSSM